MKNDFVFWEVDAQQDFILPGGKLYVPGAEKLIPNIHRLVQAAQASQSLLISSACAHSTNDPEFQTFPPHCIKDTDGARIIAEGMLPEFTVVPNNATCYQMPSDVVNHSQIVIEKQSLDVFSNPHAGEIVERIGTAARFIVFGVVTEYCVKCASEGLLARGRNVFIVNDAIETLAVEQGRRTLGSLTAAGAQLVDTNTALGFVIRSA